MSSIRTSEAAEGTLALTSDKNVILYSDNILAGNIFKDEDDPSVVPDYLVADEEFVPDNSFDPTTGDIVPTDAGDIPKLPYAAFLARLQHTQFVPLLGGGMQIQLRVSPTRAIGLGVAMDDDDYSGGDSDSSGTRRDSSISSNRRDLRSDFHATATASSGAERSKTTTSPIGAGAESELKSRSGEAWMSHMLKEEHFLVTVRCRGLAGDPVDRSPISPVDRLTTKAYKDSLKQAASAAGSAGAGTGNGVGGSGGSSNSGSGGDGTVGSFSESAWIAPGQSMQSIGLDTYSRDALMLSTRDAKVIRLDPGEEGADDETGGLLYVWNILKPTLPGLTSSSTVSGGAGGEIYFRVTPGYRPQRSSTQSRRVQSAETDVRSDISASNKEEQTRQSAAEGEFSAGGDQGRQGYEVMLKVLFTPCPRDACVHGTCEIQEGDIPASSCACKYVVHILALSLPIYTIFFNANFYRECAPFSWIIS
jgi:hypothetical protein